MARRSDASQAGGTLRAMVGAVPVGIAVATVIGAIAISPWLVVPGAAAWLLAVALGAASRAPSRKPLDVSHLPPSIQAELAEVGAALDELQRAARSVPSDQRLMFAGIEREAEEVRESVIGLGLKAGELHRQLEAHRPEEMAERLQLLNSQLERSENDSRSKLEHEIAALERRIERREQLMERLEHYRASIRSLQIACQDLANRATDLATVRPEAWDYAEEEPERRMSEMKASVAALEEVMRRDTNVIQ